METSASFEARYAPPSYPTELADGLHVVAVIRDITERKRSEDLVRQSEERLRSVMESVKDYAIFTLDPEGQVSSWNSAAERIKGYRAEEILGQHFSRFYLPEDIERGKPEHELQMAAELGRVEDEGWPCVKTARGSGRMW
ncbi:MAG TPA: PAS domain S-box protein [Terriglobales bacterium]